MSNDLISRQAAIDAVHEDLDGCRNWNASGTETANEVEMVLDCLPSAQTWIPVTERLPEKSGKYLVTVRNGNVYAGTYSAYEGRFQCAAVAWMELPEPYREADA